MFFLVLVSSFQYFRFLRLFVFFLFRYFVAAVLLLLLYSSFFLFLAIFSLSCIFLFPPMSFSSFRPILQLNLSLKPTVLFFSLPQFFSLSHDLTSTISFILHFRSIAPNPSLASYRCFSPSLISLSTHALPSVVSFSISVFFLLACSHSISLPPFTSSDSTSTLLSFPKKFTFTRPLTLSFLSCTVRFHLHTRFPASASLSLSPVLLQSLSLAISFFRYLPSSLLISFLASATLFFHNSAPNFLSISPEISLLSHPSNFSSSSVAALLLKSSLSPDQSTLIPVSLALPPLSSIPILTPRAHQLYASHPESLSSVRAASPALIFLFRQSFFFSLVNSFPHRHFPVSHFPPSSSRSLSLSLSLSLFSEFLNPVTHALSPIIVLHL